MEIDIEKTVIIGYKLVVAAEDLSNRGKDILPVMYGIGVLGFVSLTTGLIVEIVDAFTKVHSPTGEIMVILGLAGTVVGAIAESRREFLKKRDDNETKTMAKAVLRDDNSSNDI